MRKNLVLAKERSRGSALVMAIFALVLISGMGTALLFLSRNEARMSQTSLRLKKAFYLAEAGVEDARTTLFLTNGEGPFGDDLETAAGVDLAIDFDPNDLRATYSADGNVTGLIGFGDDVPLRSMTSLDTSDNPGWYAAFLTNDPVEGVATTADANDRVMITGVGAGADRSLELVQAIIRPYQFIPSVPSAAVTLLGPLPSYNNGNSNAQAHTGNDCGVTGGAYAPIVGTVGAGASAQVQAGMVRADTFESGPYVEQSTIGDLTNPADPIVADSGHGTIDPVWEDCEALKEIMLTLALNADYYCNSDTDACSIPSTGPNDVVFIDGDLSGTPPGAYSGILAITGSLVYNGNTGWDGVIMAIGEGSILRSGGGTGLPSGAVIMAAIDPTPDGPNADKSDWCTTPPDGFGSVQYDTTGAGNSEVEWCTGNINSANSTRSYRVVEFLQR